MAPSVENAAPVAMPCAKRSSEKNCDITSDQEEDKGDSFQRDRSSKDGAARHTGPRERLVAVFGEVEGLLAGSAFRGCRFISAAPESQPGEAGELVAEKYRAWLWSLFTDLAKAVGARDPKQVGRQLFLLYDGAAVAARMDEDRDAAAKAVRSAVMALLDTAVPAQRKSRKAH